jgi:hypothetical protein
MDFNAKGQGAGHIVRTRERGYSWKMVETVPTEGKTETGFLKDICAYFRDFLDTDFKRQSAPKRSVTLIRPRPLRRNSESDLDLADVGGEAGAARHGLNIALTDLHCQVHWAFFNSPRRSP